MEGIINLLREKKARFKSAIAGTPGFTFRTLNDADGEIATLLTVVFDTKERAQAVADRIGSKTIDKSGWHVYSNMEQILNQLTVTPEKCPFTCPHNQSDVRYYRGMLPRTDDILSRAMNISIGVSDGGLGAGFGIIATSDDAEIDSKAAEFVQAVRSCG
jgi:8-amino-3,8-dideoxy-alpha-D-manno-octulosonate transaminase